jgi:hypothetical protein
MKKIPTLLYVGKGIEYMPFHDFQFVPFAYLPLGTNFKSQKGLYSSLFPIFKYYRIKKPSILVLWKTFQNLRTMGSN